MNKKDPTNPCKDNHPKVINRVIIKECLEEMGLKGEAGRLAREEGIPWDEVKEIRLEYLNLLRIDYLWVLPALTNLSLSNNLIELIENLDSLIHLKHLDLSFNKIKKIENINVLVNIENLSFYDNLITVMENFEKLTKLRIFSIGYNAIEDIDNVFYLRKFNDLSSVNMKGNPCTEQVDFRIFIATFLPQIGYYEYILIEECERTAGQEIYQRKLYEIEKGEKEMNDIMQKLKEEVLEAELQSESFVEFLNTNQLFEQMFENDSEGLLEQQTLINEFMRYNRIVGIILAKSENESKELFNEFQKQTLESCMQIFTMGQEQYHLRKKEVESFIEKVEGAKVKNQEESISHMEEFSKMKPEMYDKMYKNQEDVVNRELSSEGYNKFIEVQKNEYADHIHNVWKKLMGLEIILFEQICEVNEIFELALTEMITTFIEAAQGGFAQVRTLEAIYTENINEYAQRYMGLAQKDQVYNMPPELIQFINDKDGLQNCLATSHDIHLQIIDNREDALVSRAKEWLKNLVTDLQKNEITRDRAKILEINHFLDLQRADFESVCRFDMNETDDKD